MLQRKWNESFDPLKITKGEFTMITRREMNGSLTAVFAALAAGSTGTVLEAEPSAEQDETGETTDFSSWRERQEFHNPGIAGLKPVSCERLPLAGAGNPAGYRRPGLRRLANAQQPRRNECIGRTVTVR